MFANHVKKISNKGKTKMEITASTVYTPEVMIKFLKFNMFKGRFYKIKPYIYCVLVTVFIIISIIYQLFLGFQAFMTAAAIILTIACIIQIFAFLIYPKLKVKQFNINNLSKNSYIFDENKDFFEFYNSEHDTKNNIKIKYQDLFRIFETKGSIYIYLNQISAFIIDKSQLQKDTITSITHILKVKTSKENKKYIICFS